MRGAANRTLQFATRTAKGRGGRSPPSGYPSYGLFDKEGRLVTKEAPDPVFKDKLIQTLEEQLDK